MKSMASMALSIYVLFLAWEGTAAVKLGKDAPTDGKTSPALARMFQGYDETVNAVSSQVAALQTQLMQERSKAKTHLMDLKQVYDSKLASQDKNNQELVSENAGIAKTIIALNASNTGMVASLKQLKEGNILKRQRMQQLKKTLQQADELLDASLAQAPEGEATLAVKALSDSEDRRGPATAFLAIAERGLKEELINSDDRDDADDHGDDNDAHHADAPVAGLALEAENSSTVDDDTMVELLHRGLQKLKKQTVDSEAELKDIFKSDMKKLKNRNKSLLSQQANLKVTLEKLEKYQQKLGAAEKELKDVRDSLSANLDKEARLLSQGQELASNSHDHGDDDNDDGMMERWNDGRMGRWKNGTMERRSDDGVGADDDDDPDDEYYDA